MRRKRKIYIEVDRIKSLSPGAPLYAGWCRGCYAETEMITFDEAADILRADVGKVVEQTAGGEVHLGIRPEALLVCLNSLLRTNRIQHRYGHRTPETAGENAPPPAARGIIRGQ